MILGIIQWDTIVVAGIVAVAGPTSAGMLLARQARINKREDWERQDELEARKAAEAEEVRKKNDEYTKAVIANQVVTLEATKEVARVAGQATMHAKAAQDEAVESRAHMSNVVEEIHAWVNSDMTQARQADLAQTQITLQVLRKLVNQDIVAGRQPTAEDIEAISRTEERISELQAIVDKRLALQAKMNAEGPLVRATNKVAEAAVAAVAAKLSENHVDQAAEDHVNQVGTDKEKP